MAENLILPGSHHDAMDAHGFTDFFDHIITADRWTITKDGSATVSCLEAGKAGVTIATGATDNQEGYVHTSFEQFLIAEGKPIVGRFKLAYVEAATSAANICVGFFNAGATQCMLDDGAGPKASYSGACFFKVDGGTRWQVESSDAGDQTTTDTEQPAGAASIAPIEPLEIRITPVDSAIAEIEFWYGRSGKDLHQLREYGSNPRTPAIKHSLTYNSAEPMDVVLGCKAGAGSDETPIFYQASCWQKY